MYVLNICRVDYKYKLSALSPIISKTTSSNIVSTQIINEKLKMNKFVDKENSGLFNLLKYTVVISNISDERTENLYFIDKIPEGTSFLQNSVTINNIRIQCLDPEVGFYIKDLEGKEKVILTFKAIILKSCFTYIKNSSDIEYDYIYNIEEEPIRRYKESNVVKTKYENNLFKQILITKTIKLSINIDSIIKVKCVPQILNTKLINTYIKGKCGVLILGRMKCHLVYKYKGSNYYKEEVFGFSTLMLAPIGIIYLNKVDIKTDIEYSCSELINRNTIFINSSLLLYC